MSKDKVIELAVAEAGYVEGKNNLNKFAPVAGHANNQPWCNTFISAIFIQAGIREAIPITASCAATLAWGLKHKRLIQIEKAKRGDLLIFDFTKSGHSEHIGIALDDFNVERKIIHTIEGNTGEKSQANGEGVYIKTRSKDFIKAVIRPLYETPGATQGEKVKK
ncbi:Endopeptidase, NLPC/P60 domain containing protein [uncultured Caudovirales phage]|uniref:Endopeptidase, NLPC/P60 domain containing protein n=1 Tax=uncultured Caudovirales phage TaxID=2100421 RepID=A0A6J5RCP9_9CAUD|nr:Endopeptidase, NLPC/P60 domain containing protein [uncultured Caudovirales phage]